MRNFQQRRGNLNREENILTEDISLKKRTFQQRTSQQRRGHLNREENISTEDSETKDNSTEDIST
jgi:hypothetical protein